MKGIAQLALAATLVAGAQAHQHHHRHLHAKKNVGSPIEKRAPEVITKYVEGPTVVMYELDGQAVDAKKAEAGIKDGIYSVVGETTPTFTTPAAPSSTTSQTSTSTSQAAQFFEQKVTSSASSSATTTAAGTSSTASASSGSSSGAKGIDAEFPSGELSCDSLPTDYGAKALSWIGLNGWASIQSPSDKKWTPGVLINTIDQAVSGGCDKESFCSYACPSGYQKTQWPESSQGATGQSIGGLWCNSDGKLELTRPEYKTLCQKGAGGVYVQNKLSGEANICQTNYPGDEKMSIPTSTTAGGKFELMNPNANTSYWWKGSPTSAQYYVNNLNVPVDEACVWTSSKYPDSAGNWSPTILGVGQDIFGITYISIFKNLPTSTAELDFDIDITGDVTATCSLKSGVYTGGGNGCTTAISKTGGTATIVFSKSS